VFVSPIKSSQEVKSLTLCLAFERLESGIYMLEPLYSSFDCLCLVHKCSIYMYCFCCICHCLYEAIISAYGIYIYMLLFMFVVSCIIA